MNYSPLESKLLDKIKQDNFDFSINNNLHLKELLSKNLSVNDFKGSNNMNLPDNDIADIEVLKYIMYINKDITLLLPEKTRFRFIKRVIKRLMKVSTRYQQEYNNAAFETIKYLITSQLQLKNKIEQIELKQSLINQEHQKQIEQIESKQSLINQEHQKQIEQINNKLEEQHKYILEQNEIVNNLKNNLTVGSDGNQEGSMQMMSSSQAGEDCIISYALKALNLPVSSCTYLDIGANHPIDFSNTYFMYQKGARGVLVDANPQLIPKLKFYRPEDIVLNNIVCNEPDKTMDFYILSGDGLSTANYESVQASIKEAPWIKIVDTVKVKSISIKDIIDKYFEKAPTVLNIDIEGMEMDILNSIDFEKFRPLFIIIEMIPFSKDLVVGIKNQEIIDFMKKHDYTEYAFSGINSIFINNRR